MKPDPETEFGQHVLRRLKDERIIWLTTVDQNNVPQPRPVWFWWDGDTFLIYSRPNTHKLEHIARNPHVALHLDGDGLGGDIVVFTGQAFLDPEAPAANQVPAYTTKYRAGFERIKMTPQQFASAFSVAVRVRPDKLRGH